MKHSHHYPFWSPRFWHGMRLGDWLRFWAANGWRVHPLRLPMAAGILAVSTFNSTMAPLQRLAYGRRVAATEPPEPPIFIIGHWRSGTTLLHELMALDERWTWPTTYECFAPHHCLVTGPIIARYFGFLLPKQRPMDNVASGWDRPQEDEFALLTLGAPTPYRRMAFPDRPPPDEEFLDMDAGRLPPKALAHWKNALVGFVRLITFLRPKRLVLKSPPHTGRVQMLAELFPGARFVHIVRHPYVLFASTRHLWESLDAAQGVQLPRHQQLDEYIFRTLLRMYDGFHRQRPQLADDQICDVRYERLVEDPVSELERVYERLGLGAFEQVRPRLEQYARDNQGYKTSRYELDSARKAEIYQRWNDYFQRYGYEP